ncbi:FG-GAP repeat domain-containing protein [Amycolatopsis sp. NPDC088138]|uniref:FG-GAP repeat domain-containing protein n=1 Tax=Amycolatopsis sp. NPDC088138 TaxID=3363938 RepID=UPI00381DEE5F
MSTTFVRRAATAAATFAAILTVASPAYASIPNVYSGPQFVAAATTAACDSAGTTGRDASLATQLNSSLSAKMKGSMSAYRVSCAREVVDAVRDRGLASRAAVIAITTVIVETGLQNIDEEVDHDSLGLFQQRAGWGTVAQRLNPRTATNAFLDKMLREYPNDSWKTAVIGDVCQAVQVSAFPDRYQPQAGDAQKIVNALWTTRAADGADFNDDGVGDIFSTATGVITIWNGKGSNNFNGAVTYGRGWDAYSRPISGDFNDDGVSDLAATSNGQLHIWNGRGDNDFTADVVTGPGWSPYAATLFTVGDINGDGHTDIGAVSDGTLYTWNGLGNNKFGAAVVHGAGWSPYTRPVGGDFNGDGIGDIAAVADGELHIWNGKGSNNFAADVVTGPGWSPYAASLMDLGDINGDGHTDLGGIGSGTLYTWNGLGANKFGAAVVHGAGWSPYF